MIHEPNANGAKPRGKIAGSKSQDLHGSNRRPCGIYYYFAVHASCQQLEPYGSLAAWLRYPPKVSIPMWQLLGSRSLLGNHDVDQYGDRPLYTGWTACVSA